MTDDEKPREKPDYTLPSPDLSIFGETGPASTGKPTEVNTADTVTSTTADATADTVVNTEPGEQPLPAGWALGRPQGTMRFQDPLTTTPQEPTLAERRARKHAEDEAAAQQAQRQLTARRQATTRRRVMIGSGVAVGAVALVGAWYLLSPPNVTAYCIGADPTDRNSVVSDQYCDASYVTSHGGHISNGMIFLPLMGGGYRQYRYYYGGTVSGGRVSGGTLTEPSHSTIRTGSGTTIKRGGFGISGSGKSGGTGGGKSGGS